MHAVESNLTIRDVRGPLGDGSLADRHLLSLEVCHEASKRIDCAFKLFTVALDKYPKSLSSADTCTL